MALVAALAAHLPLLLLPELGTTLAAAPEEEPPVFVMRSHRFRPPPPPPTAPPDPPPPQETAVRVPIPDPTPTVPEPLREIELPPLPEPLPANVVFLEPDPPPAPPAPAPARVTELRVGGAVARPERLFAPHPAYTETARRARIEGTTILEVRLDETGAVSRVEVLKGLPLGLTEAAVEAVSRWRYEPARLDGEPVPVLMTVTVHFELD